MLAAALFRILSNLHNLHHRHIEKKVSWKIEGCANGKHISYIIAHISTLENNFQCECIHTSPP